MMTRYWRAIAEVVLLALLPLGLMPSMASAAVSFVQSTYNDTGGSAADWSVAATFTNPVTAQNLIAVLVTWGTATNDLTSVTDSRGNSYAIQSAFVLTDGGNTQTQAVAYAKNIAGGTNTVTANFSTTPGWRVIAIHEISGADLTAPLDGVTGLFQTSVATTANAVTSGSITTTANGDYIFGATVNTSAFPTITAGTSPAYTIRTNNSPNSTVANIGTEDRVQSTAGSIAATFTIDTTGQNMATFIMAFKPPTCAAVSDATYVAANAQNAQATVYWSSANPVVILRDTSAFSTQAPANGTTYAVGNTGGSLGTAVVQYVGSATSLNQGSLTNGTTYYYKVFTNQSVCYSPGIAINATPNTGAGAPVWSYATLATSLAAPGIDPNDVVIVGSNDMKLHGMNASNGTLAFAPFATGGAIQARPVVIPADYSTYDTLTGLAYWKFDEGSGTTTADSSGNGNTGTLTGSPVPAWTAGYRQNALSFDGTQNYVSVPHTAALNAYPITVTAWFKTSVTTSAQSIVNKYVSASMNGYNVFLYNGGLCAWYFTNGTTNNAIYDSSSGGNCTLSPGVTVNNNTWHHVAFVVDTVANGGGKLYVDGALKATRNWTGSAGATTTTQGISIGRYTGSGGTPYFPGLIDEVRIYGRALSAAEVLGVYSGLNIAYVPAQDAFVYAINTSTGAQVWKSPSLGAINELRGGAAVWLRSIKALPICGANTDAVFVGTFITGSDLNKVYALNGGNTTVTTTGGGNCTSASVPPGGILWTFTGGPTLSATAMRVIYSTPYVDYANNALWVTSHSTGTTTPSVWKFNVSNGTRIVPTPSTLWNSFDDISASPTPSSDGTFMYVGTLAGTLSAIRLSDGAVFNCTPPGCGGSTGTGEIKGLPWPLGGSPEEIVFTRNTTIHKVSFNTATATFSTNWTIQLTGTPNVSAPVDDFAGNIYVGTSLGKVHRIQVSNGAVMGQVTITASPTPTVGDPAFDGVLNRIYVGATDGHIYTFSPGF
jgi:hypothetical protein